jgi:hypothetical protein
MPATLRWVPDGCVSAANECGLNMAVSANPVDAAASRRMSFVIEGKFYPW